MKEPLFLVMALPTTTPENLEVMIGFGLFFLSEAIGMSKYKDNSVIQLALHAASRAFPYELKRRKQARPTSTRQPHRDTQAAALFTKEMLDEFNVQELRAMARSFGAADLGSKGRRDELVSFLLTIAK
jgi:hypothetical protein